MDFKIVSLFNSKHLIVVKHLFSLQPIRMVVEQIHSLVGEIQMVEEQIHSLVGEIQMMEEVHSVFLLVGEVLNLKVKN